MGFDFTVNKEVITGFDTRYTRDFASVKIGPNQKKHFTMEFMNTFGNSDWGLNVNMAVDSGSNITDSIKPALSFQSNNIQYHPVFKVLNFPKISEKIKK